MSLVKAFMKSIWIPVIWALLVVIQMVAFADGPPQNAFLYLLDRLVLFSCFLLYPVKTFASDSVVVAVLGFGLQFLFWWVVGFFLYAKVINRSGAK